MITPRASDSGMSLIETLMAVFIFAIASSLIVLSLPERISPLESDANRLSQSAQMARDKALTSGEWTGVLITGETYRQVTYRSGEWVPAGRRIQKFSGGVSIEQAQRASSPALQFGPTGTAAAKAIWLTHGAESYVLRVSPDGQISLEARSG